MAFRRLSISAEGLFKSFNKLRKGKCYTLLLSLQPEVVNVYERARVPLLRTQGKQGRKRSTNIPVLMQAFRVSRPSLAFLLTENIIEKDNEKRKK